MNMRFFCRFAIPDKGTIRKIKMDSEALKERFPHQRDLFALSN